MIETWDEYAIVNNALERLVESSDTIPKVKKALKHIIRAGGKRTRPIIVLLSGKLCGGSYKDVLNMALAVELIHTASLAHDDVIDRGVVRRNVKALHVEFNLPLAILVGDWLISKSVELTSVYGEEVVREFATVGMMMSEGEVIDVYSVKEEFDESDYFKCIISKTASLFAYSAKNACKVVSKDPNAAERMYSYGLNLGIAYQLVDDLLEYLEIYEDKKSEFESKTLPLIYEERIGFKESVVKVLELIKSYAKKSVDALNYFENNEYKYKLLKMVEFMTSDLLKSYVSRNKEVLKLLESYY